MHNDCSLIHAIGFRLFPFRSPLLRESILFLLLRVLRCFTSPGLLLLRGDFPLKKPGCPIRISTGLRLLAPHRGLTQLATSFFAHLCQGIHHMLWITWLLISYFAQQSIRISHTEILNLYMSMTSKSIILRLKPEINNSWFQTWDYRL